VVAIEEGLAPVEDHRHKEKNERVEVFFIASWVVFRNATAL
jgi:hypothetical protein